MKEFLIKARRAIRYLFYKNVSIQDQLNVSKVLDDSELELLFWKLSMYLDRYLHLLKS